MDGEMNVDEFIQTFQSQKTTHHLRKIKSEKLRELLRSRRPTQYSYRYQRALDSRSRTARITRFPLIKTVNAHEPASFQWEKRDMFIILLRFCKNVFVSKQVQNVGAVLAIFDQLPGIRITEQPDTANKE